MGSIHVGNHHVDDYLAGGHVDYHRDVEGDLTCVSEQHPLTRLHPPERQPREGIVKYQRQRSLARIEDLDYGLREDIECVTLNETGADGRVGKHRVKVDVFLG